MLFFFLNLFSCIQEGFYQHEDPGIFDDWWPIKLKELKNKIESAFVDSIYPSSCSQMERGVG